MSLDKETVRKVARLARLKMSDEELEKYVPQLNNIIGFVEQLGEVDTDDVAPLPSPVDIKLRLREDGVTDGGYPEEVLRAILAHRASFTGVEPTSELDQVLMACDELSGLVYACCLVRPNGIDDLKPKSVVKKLKDKTFAAGVSREEVQHGLDLIGLERTEHVQNVIDALRGVGAELGIRAEDRA